MNPGTISYIIAFQWNAFQTSSTTSPATMPLKTGSQVIRQGVIAKIGVYKTTSPVIDSTVKQQ